MPTIAYQADPKTTAGRHFWKSLLDFFFLLWELNPSLDM
jgi:hypothetical protein